MGRLLPSNGCWTPPSMLAGGTFGLPTVLNDGSQFQIETLKLYTLISDNTPCEVWVQGVQLLGSPVEEKTQCQETVWHQRPLRQSLGMFVCLSAQACCSNFFGAPCL